MRGKVTIAYDDGSASPHILWEQWRLARVFKAYKRLLQMESHIVNQRRQGRFGILAHSDPLAIKYQQRVAWRKEVIEAHFEGRTPNQYVKTWYRPNAPHEPRRDSGVALNAVVGGSGTEEKP